MTAIARLLAVTLPLLPAAIAHAGQPDATHWVTAWTGAAQGPYPSGNPSAQPVLSFAFPSAEAGAHDQSFRLIVRPDIWGPQARLRLANVLGTRPVTFDHVSIGRQASGAELVAHSLRAVTFAGAASVTVPPGQSVWSDAAGVGGGGGKLAVSFHVAGDSGPMTWHAKALTTSYLSRPGAGADPAAADSELGFPFSTTSWYFLDAVDMAAPEATRAVVAFGDSITDGTASTLNGDDRWPDVLSRRLHAAYGDHFAVVNEGIGGNQVVGPASYTPQTPFAGGPSAGDRLERDVLALSGVATVIWLEGINDLGAQGNATPDAIEAGMTTIVGRLRQRLPGVRIIAATATSALGSSNAAHGSVAEDAARQTLNAFIRKTGLFDAVVDFDAATTDRNTGSLRAEYIPESTTGGAGDKLHPNRAGYQAMGAAIPLDMFAQEPVGK